MLEPKGIIVTADTLSCQRTIAWQIVEQGGDCCLALKGNQGTLHDDVRRCFDGPDSESVTTRPVVEGDRGRIGSRTATIVTAVTWLACRLWPGLEAIGKVVRCREVAGKTATGTASCLPSCPRSPERLNEVARLHRGVENRLHWRLDVVMNEDQDRTRMDHGPHNIAVLRHMALDAVPKEGSKGSLRGQFKRAGWGTPSRPFLNRDHPARAAAVWCCLKVGPILPA